MMKTSEKWKITSRGCSVPSSHISHRLKIGVCVCLQFAFFYFSVGFLLIMDNKLIIKKGSLCALALL